MKCRAIIVHEGKLLVVSHPHDTSFYALPGGHLEWGETPQACVRREVVEELGVEPELGRLLYVNTYLENSRKHVTEFFFEVLNSADFVHLEGRERTHAFELQAIRWLAPEDDAKILPEQFGADFRGRRIFSDSTRYIGK